jgi:hypothetical protein
VHVDPVLHQAAQEPDRGSARRAALGQRRLGQDDERAHRFFNCDRVLPMP